jgi:hypothetical protein
MLLAVVNVKAFRFVKDGQHRFLVPIRGDAPVDGRAQL